MIGSKNIGALKANKRVIVLRITGKIWKSKQKSKQFYRNLGICKEQDRTNKD